jgi:hypothetical protein
LPVLALLTRALPGVGADEPVRFSLQGFVDLRAIQTSPEIGWLDGGLGKARYGEKLDESRAGIRLAQTSILFRASYGDVAGIRVQANIDTDPVSSNGVNGLDLIEAVLSARPRLARTLDLKLRAGLFFPPISLENDGPAWSPTRTITASAINSWIGEEVRTVGVEGSLVLLLPAGDLSLTGAVFGYNDPAGTLLAWRGWAVQDRQTGLSDRLPLPQVSSLGPSGIFPKQAPWTAPFREIDGRAGWYAGISYHQPEFLDLRGLLYDNRANPLLVEDGQYSWHTRFESLGARVQLPAQFELMAQAMEGYTWMGPDDAVAADYASWFVLASKAMSRHRFTLRYEEFWVDDEDRFQVEDQNGEFGSAWTMSYVYSLAARQSVFVEYSSIESERASRQDLGRPPRVREDVMQISFRFGF